MKLFYIILGSTALALGMLGIFLPLLPTTPFLLLSAWFYCKGSDRLYGWLMSHPYLGSYIRNYREKRAITLQSKATAVSLMFVTILICILFVAESLWLKILLAAIFAAVSWHILSFRTMRRDENLRLFRVRKAGEIGRTAALLHGETSVEGDQNEPCAAAIAARMKKGYEYYLLRADGTDVGCAVLKPCADGTLLLDSLRIAEGARGKGYARDTFLFIDYYGRYREVHTVRLSVDKRNGRGIAVCVKSGFMITGSGPVQAPDGSVSEHYFMERSLLPPRTR